MTSRHHLPIFPLPDLVLFPHTLLPLHVFEPRYRAMTTDALARDRRLAIVGLKAGYEPDYTGRPPVHAVAGVGRIIQCERLASGRFNMILRGEGRVRLARELPTDTLYRVVEADELAEEGGDGEEVPALVDLVKRTCRHILQAVRRPPPRWSALAGPAEPGVLCDQVASALIPAPAARQALLEERTSSPAAAAARGAVTPAQAAAGWLSGCAGRAAGVLLALALLAVALARRRRRGAMGLARRPHPRPVRARDGRRSPPGTAFAKASGP